jgi:hypothetical protein
MDLLDFNRHSYFRRHPVTYYMAFFQKVVSTFIAPLKHFKKSIPKARAKKS